MLRRRFWKKVQFVTVLGVLLFVQSIANAAPLIRSDDRVWMLGDSHAYMLTRLVRARAEADGIAFGGGGIGGSSIFAWGEGRYGSELARMRRFRPSVALVLLGSNDAYMGKRWVETRVEEKLNRLLARLQVRVVWVGPPTLERAREGNESVYKLLKKERDLFDLVDARPMRFDMLEDKLHCAPEREGGCPRWASLIWQAVRQ